MSVTVLRSSCPRNRFAKSVFQSKTLFRVRVIYVKVFFAQSLKFLSLIGHLDVVEEFVGLVEPPKVTIMILNYNGLRWLPNCLSSVARTDYSNLDVCLVDNGSVDGSLEYVRKNFPSVKVIQHPRNLGFAKG